MGWRERDYWRASSDEPGPFSRLRLPPRACLVLIVLHAAAFVLGVLIRADVGPAARYLPELAGDAAQPAGIGLHPFAATSLLSVLITIAVIWGLAGGIEERDGPQRMLGLYLVGNVLAGVGYFAVARLAPTLAVVPLDYPAGAMGAWCYVAWRALAGATYLIFGRICSAMRVIAVGAIAAIGLMLLLRGPGTLAWLMAVALGALAALGLEFVWRARIPRRPAAVRRAAWNQPCVTSARPSRPPIDEPDIDDILAKISREGLESLTSEERDRLEAARQAKLRRPP